MCITSGDKSSTCKGCEADKGRVKYLTFDSGHQLHKIQLNFYCMVCSLDHLTY